ncbi:patatin-like phospholipase family protein [Brevundimonas viscosa]|uniref:Patatin-like phospholipase n=1 Tax=Brevundimonas viscosa TaxID=871741 RepID=A0A1I6P7P9_9CAUL|nr:patatin-like phospholipase family protein [Brevundimonas viscosa]SFS36217.1 Patatin-like phospholipase [Brevundimonas viscosa]
MKQIRIALIASSLLILSACATVDRAPKIALHELERGLVATQDPRILPNDQARLDRIAEDFRRRLTRGDQRRSILALSGGGANGAYGAGMLVGWSQRGDRPEFDIVTGVSTGALAAPYAFLGSDWDDELAAAYSEGHTEGLLSWRSFAAFLSPGLFSPRTLEALVEEHVTPALLTEIAQATREGRRLLVATTNLDSGETVIWDMGLLAEAGDENALRLFRQVLLASASIPGVFPPVLIAGVTESGTVQQELHVDGGVNTPFLGVPEGMILSGETLPGWRGSELFIIVNGKLGLSRRQTRGSLPSVFARSYQSMTQSLLRTSLAAQGAFARRNGMRISVAAIPQEVEASALDFDQDAMKALFEEGRRRAVSGSGWVPLDAEVVEPPSPQDAEPAAEPAPDAR